MSEFSLLHSKVLFDSPLVRIVRDTVAHGDHKHRWYCLEGPTDAVACVALTDDGQLVLTRQYRHAVRQTILDLPAGRVSPGETLAQAMARELQEETGYRAAQIELLGRFVQFPSTIGTASNIFLATGLAPGPAHLDDGEELEVVHASPADVLQGVLRGDYVDGSLQLGVLLAAQKGLIHL